MRKGKVVYINVNGMKGHYLDMERMNAVHEKTTEALMVMKLQMMKCCEVGDIVAAATLLEMAHIVVGLSYKILDRTNTPEERDDWETIVDEMLQA